MSSFQWCPSCRAQGKQIPLQRLTVHLIDLHGNNPDPPVVTAHCSEDHCFLVKEWEIVADRDIELELGPEVEDVDDPLG